MDETSSNGVSSVAQPEAKRHDGPGRVISVFLTLALFVGALAFLARGFFVAPVDGAAKQREYFGAEEPPFGLALDVAQRLPTGDALVRFTRTGEGRAPLDVLFIEYQSRAAAEALLRPTAEEMGMGGGSRLKEWEREKAFDWHTTVKRADIAWGEWSSKLLVERSFRKGGGWSEQARVNISSGQRNLVLFANWPDETPVDEKILHELLLALDLPRPAD